MKADERRCRDTVTNRADTLCERCHRTTGVDHHHRRNRSQGGKWTPANIVLLCRPCHHLVTVDVPLARAEGFNVRSFEDERVVPVLRWGSWVVLDDAGGMKPVDLIPDSSGISLNGEALG